MSTGRGQNAGEAALREALRRGVGDLALAIGSLEAHWEVCCGDPEHLPPVELRTTLAAMTAALNERPS